MIKEFVLTNMASAQFPWHIKTHSADEPGTETSHDNTEGPKHDRNPFHDPRRRMQILIVEINSRVDPAESPQRITPNREPLVRRRLIQQSRGLAICQFLCERSVGLDNIAFLD